MASGTGKESRRATFEINFHDSKTPHPQLEIVSDKRDPHAGFLSLEVHPPVIGAFPLDRRMTCRSSPSNQMEGLVTWSYPQSDFGEFRYTACYWEWVEDVLSCKKVVLECVKWDMCMIGGLPVHGDFYDEDVPSIQELTQGCLSNGINQGGVTILTVISTCHFYHGLRKRMLLSSTKKLDNIRPNIFKLLSLMDQGEKFSLVIPVLAGIYRILKDISTSSYLGASNIIFPIQYLYVWIGGYFDTYYQATHHYNGARMCKIAGERMAKYFDHLGARGLFWDVDTCNLHHKSLMQSKELSVIDNNEFSSSWNDYFINLRSSYVTI
ncbi:hypothetical protein HAX54_022035 [Datura stramonium]|uniref:Uncharacterized protein n=1 Tax=Datura stramonium TaxID=4076 RepID=A0ABS8UVP4_DATST|nr:hypothetical protein [Datura stramonium]